MKNSLFEKDRSANFLNVTNVATRSVARTYEIEKEILRHRIWDFEVFVRYLFKKNMEFLL